MTLEIRFMRHVRKQEDGHWIWQGDKLKSGHGRFRIGDKHYLAHRVARYIYCNFDLNSDLNVNHKIECTNSLCVNPMHTYEGTQWENVRDIIKFGNNYNSNKTFCKNGHEFNEENTRLYKNGRRCRTCQKESYRKEKENKRRIYVNS